MGTLAAVMIAGLGMGGVFPSPLALPIPGPRPAQTAGYSKEDLKKLLEAKVSEATIVAFIKRNPPAPILSTQDLLDLRSAGATDAVLVAVLQASGNAAPAAPAAPSTPPSYSDGALLPDGVYSGVPSYGYDDYYPYYPYPYWSSYPYYSFGFGVRFPFRDNRFDNRFHHFDHFEHFHQGPRGPVSGVRGGFHGAGSAGGGHGGGGHR